MPDEGASGPTGGTGGAGGRRFDAERAFMTMLHQLALLNQNLELQRREMAALGGRLDVLNQLLSTTSSGAGGGVVDKLLDRFFPEGSPGRGR